MRWKPDEDESLRGWRESGLTMEQLCSNLGRTRSSIYARMFKIGMANKVNYWTPEEDSAIIAGVKGAQTRQRTAIMARLAVQLGRSLDAIRRRAKFLGMIQVIPSSCRPACYARFVQMPDNGPARLTEEDREAIRQRERAERVCGHCGTPGHVRTCQECKERGR